MKMLLFLLLMGIVGPHCTSARTHSLKYFHTGSSGVTNFPEFVTTPGESNPKDWMKKITDEDPQYWEEHSDLSGFPAALQSVHIVQRMSGCDWDDETGEVKGYQHHGFDGEDFLILDLETESWIAPKREAVLTKRRWDKTKLIWPSGRTTSPRSVLII
ncbi:hypothetical protein F7725_024692 [Dissostichus mawsoni]|uniref:MHC class I-like antigen recognition-like domain-containing protein n=1 Tax=Dissostichus mawsoni TaxID=36200 RepID=A0A7J5XAQ2_DISMA|nr:hypothetical protein F7725_024692 [Dissostichus mawsoni]